MVFKGVEIWGLRFIPITAFWVTGIMALSSEWRVQGLGFRVC